MKTYLYVYKNNILTFFYTVYDQTSVKKKCWKIIHKFVHNVLALKKKKIYERIPVCKKKVMEAPLQMLYVVIFFPNRIKYRLGIIWHLLTASSSLYFPGDQCINFIKKFLQILDTEMFFTITCWCFASKEEEYRI